MRHAFPGWALFTLLSACSARRPAAEATPGTAGDTVATTAAVPTGDAGPPAPAGGSGSAAPDPDAEPREVDRGVSLRLALDDDSLDVGDDLRLTLAFHNDSSDSATVVPPLDGSWDDMRQPLYSLEFLDDAGRPVPYALGFHEPGRCGMTNELTPSDVLDVDAHGDLALDDPLRWAAPFTVQPWARPGTWRVRVRYRADAIPGVTPLFLVSNAVPLAIEGGDERLWACRNAQVERARRHVYANVTPARFAPWGDGYVVVTHRAETTVAYPGATDTTGSILLQRLAADLAPQGEPVVVATSGVDWLGLVEVLPLPDRLLVAWTEAVDDTSRRVMLASVEVHEGAFVPSTPDALSDGAGRPYYLALAAREDRVGLVWLGRSGDVDQLFFRLLDAFGAPVGDPVPLPDSRGTASGRTPLVPTASGWLVAWHQGGPEVRWQRLDPAGRPQGDAVRVALDAGGIVALAERDDGIELVFDDNGVDNRIEGDTMGLHLAALAPDGGVRSDVALSPLDRENARFGAALRRGDRIARVFLEEHVLVFADGPDASAPRAILSETAGGMFGVWPAADDERVLAAWSDFRDDDLRRCLPVDCVTDVYVAVIGPGGNVVAGPRRVTDGAVAEPLVLYRENWQEFCPPPQLVPP
ncbi:MAG: hypothetical protein HY907_04665 [Deltaproteobacteria bacterium]|nr:hypothetical protein [Deltaproteobacteria bacterium]